jgi:branched-chain amino acid transport system substrate-binding protein
MKMRKMLAVTLLLAFVLVMAAGCGNANATKTEGAAATGTQAAAEPSEVVLGANFELSGPVAVYGQTKMNGVEIAIDEINKSGGILGKQVKLIKYDNKGDDAEALSLTTRLMTEDKIVTMLGPVTSGRVMVAVPVSAQFKIPLVTGTGTAAAITVADGKVNDYAFRICYTDAYQGGLAGKFAATSLGGKTAAMLVNQNDDYSIGLAEAFKGTFEQNGGKVIEQVSFTNDDQNFNTALTKIIAANPDVLFVPAYYEQDALIAKQARELGYTKPIIGGDGWDSSDYLLQTAGAAALQEVYFVNHYFSGDTDPAVKAFVDAYTAKFNETPSSFSALGYDTAMYVKNAIEQAGTLDPVKIRDAMAATKDFKGITGTLTMGENHDPIKSAVVITFDQDGKPILKEKLQ